MAFPLSKFFSFLFILSLLPARLNVNSISPDVITEQTPHDTDDPAIWVNKANPSKSIVFGTDKRNSDGAIYAFDLEGKIIEEKTLRGLERPNNVDIHYDFPIGKSEKTDVLAFTERGRKRVRLFSVPEMKPLDNGGFPVFQDEKDPELRKPMGISFYRSASTGDFYLIVGRKKGPRNEYLYQYKLRPKRSKIGLELVRKFGNFSGIKEIEAIAVDDELGYVYYSDEGFGIRKYHAEPSMGSVEVGCFGNGLFKKDVEGIAIAELEDGEGFLIVSNQQNDTFNIFSRDDNSFLKEIDLESEDTDGCEVVVMPLNSTFSTGLFVAMNDERNFFFYDYSKLGLGE